MQQYSSLYIDGQWCNSLGKQLDVINPADGAVCASVPAATAADVEAAIQAARAAFDNWSQTSAEQRSQLMCAAADEMQARADELATAISMTMGCPLSQALEIQVQGAIDAFRDYAGMTDYVEQVDEQESFYGYYSPVGVCVLINPWNYPLSQLVGKIGPALASGCTVVAKPAEQTPLQDFLLAEIFDKVGLPAGVFNVVSGVGADIGEQLCSHPEVDMVSFTGSTAAGIKVAEAAAAGVKRVCQELGGKSPYIITADADLEAAVRYGVEDVMLNSGQTCSALTRMLVPQSLYQRAVAIAKFVAEENIVGDPAVPATTLGPLSSRAQQQRVLDYIQLGLDEGATLVSGGAELPESLRGGAYVMPTIFADVDNTMRIAREEIFGPVLCVIPYQTEQQALTIANDSDYGLSSAIYAKDRASALKLARKIRAGQCYVQGSYFNSHAPFGGFKQSGNGREWGTEGLKEFIEVQSVIIE